MFFHSGHFNVRMPFQQHLIFMIQNNTGHLASRIEFSETLRYSSLKYIKSGLSRKNQDERDSYVQ
jgi:hypothetical protein